MRQISNVEVGGVLLSLSSHLSLNTLSLELVNSRQCAGGRLEVHKAVTLAPVSCLVQYGLRRNDGTKPGDTSFTSPSSWGQLRRDLLLTQIDEVLVCGVRGEASDVEISPGQRLSLLDCHTPGVRGRRAASSSASIVAGWEG